MTILNQPIHISYFFTKILLDWNRQELIKQEDSTELETCLSLTTQAMAPSNNIQQCGGYDVKN